MAKAAGSQWPMVRVGPTSSQWPMVRVGPTSSQWPMVRVGPSESYMQMTDWWVFEGVSYVVTYPLCCDSNCVGGCLKAQNSASMHQGNISAIVLSIINRRGNPSITQSLPYFIDRSRCLYHRSSSVKNYVSILVLECCLCWNKFFLTPV